MDNREEIITRLKPIIKTYTPVQAQEKVNELNENADFITDLYINSANLVDIILDVEEEFGIVIDNESMEKMLTVKAAIDVIMLKLSEK